MIFHKLLLAKNKRYGLLIVLKFVNFNNGLKMGCSFNILLAELKISYGTGFVYHRKK